LVFPLMCLVVPFFLLICLGLGGLIFGGGIWARVYFFLAHIAAAYLQATMALERYQTKGNDKADQGEKYESVERFLEPA
ncbi:MAG: hypothetical protein R3264_01490, partial [Anaerolineae bacterium]|nr:hypothetical protein [Anaerolineae bacterium]